MQIARRISNPYSYICHQYFLSIFTAKRSTAGSQAHKTTKVEVSRPYCAAESLNSHPIPTKPDLHSIIVFGNTNQG